MSLSDEIMQYHNRSMMTIIMMTIFTIIMIITIMITITIVMIITIMMILTTCATRGATAA